MIKYAAILFPVFSISFFFSYATLPSEDHLFTCWEIQVQPLKEQWVSIHYHERQNAFYHAASPWKTRLLESKGNLWLRAKDFLQCDTLEKKDKQLVSKIMFSDSMLLIHPYWRENLAPVTTNMLTEQIYETARYSPVMLIDYFSKHKVLTESQVDSSFAVYRLKIGHAVVRLFIRKHDFLLEKVTVTEYDEMLGDITTTYSYQDYFHSGQWYYAQKIQITKANNVQDEVKLVNVELVNEVPHLLDKPSDYSIENEVKIKPDCRMEKVADHIYSVYLPHASSKASLIEFSDFLLVLDAPLNSENGEMIIREAAKLAPEKPIRYFAFGHHHAWYLGGVRPFIHKGATVLCTADNMDYISFIANAPHTLQPDSLEIQPGELRTELIEGSKTISDGSMEMQLFHIGKQSAHTEDYLIFYFPSEKLLIEDDLLWIPEKGEPKKAGERQAGLYHAIQELGLDVETIIQQWPTGEKYGVKSVVTFRELEETVKMN